MDYIESLEKLTELLQEKGHVIFVPGFRGGKTVIQWLELSDNLKYVGCFATLKKHCDDAIDAFFEKNLPLIHLDYLPHFRENESFIVATNPVFHSEIYAEMKERGFKNIFFLGTGAYDQILAEVQEIMASPQIIQKFMLNVTDKLNKLELVIEEKNEICAVNTAAFEKYRNFFRDRKVVVVGTGPTLNYYEPIRDAVHIGVNYAWRREDISFDFLFTNDRCGNNSDRDIKVEEGFDKIKERVFVGKRPHHVRVRASFDYPIDVEFRKNNVSRFYLEDVFPYTAQQICQDICRNSLANFSSTVFNAMHFALFTCPAELYLVGCDVSHGGHFYGGKYSISSSESLWVDRMKVGYARMKAFAEHHYLNTKIFSINPVNLKGLFTDIYTDEYKKSLEGE